jgi:Tn3 transposase DDE domain
MEEEQAAVGELRRLVDRMNDGVLLQAKELDGIALWRQDSLASLDWAKRYVTADQLNKVRTFVARSAEDVKQRLQAGKRIEEQQARLKRAVLLVLFCSLIVVLHQRRLLLCLYGLGTNAGPKRMCSGGGEDTYVDLQYIRRRYITKEYLRAAIARVCNAIFRVRNPDLWGEGTTAWPRTRRSSAPGTRI